MSARNPVVLAVLIGLAASGPSVAAGVIGAGSGSTGGSLTGTTNESNGQMQTGAANGGETVPDKQDKGHSVGTGDNAVLNAPREAVPGTKSGSQPSNLNGQNPQP